MNTIKIYLDLFQITHIKILKSRHSFMKKLFHMLFAVMIIGATGCNKDDNSDDNPQSNGTMNLEVDGNGWTATLSVLAVNSNGVINVARNGVPTPT